MDSKDLAQKRHVDLGHAASTTNRWTEFCRVFFVHRVACRICTYPCTANAKNGEKSYIETRPRIAARNFDAELIQKRRSTKLHSSAGRGHEEDI